MNMRVALLSIGLIGLAPAVSAEKLGDHPALVVQRLEATRGYDYASKFYPHPAWLYLLPEEPHRMNQHPAVTIARRQSEAHARAVAEAKALLAGLTPR